MEDIQIVNVNKKHGVADTDYLLVEDSDGTKIVSFKDFRMAITKTSVCDTVNILKTLSLEEGAVIRTLGYHNVNDGGAATYVIMYDPSTVDDGATCHFLKTSDTLKAKLLISGPVSVVTFGAVGDGSADDHEALQKAIDSDVPITFPTGKVFKISSPLVIPSGKSIDFNGCTINNPNSTALQIGKSGSPASGVHLSNLNIVGLRGVEVLDGCSDIHFNGVDIKGQTLSSEYGFRLQSDHDIHIIDCKVSSVQYGISVYTGNTVTDLRMICISNTVIDAVQKCIQTTGGQTHTTHISIVSCNLAATKANGSCVVYLGAPSDYVTMVGCSINNGVVGIQTIGSGTVARGYGTHIFNCATPTSGSVTLV